VSVESSSVARPPGRRLKQLARLPVSELKGVGPRKQADLESMGLASILDLLTHYPRRYADRTSSAPIAELVLGEEAVVSGRVTKVGLRRIRGRKPMVEVDVVDDTGELRLTFFNQAWRSHQLHEGMSVVVFGRAERYRSRLQMTNPLVDLVGDRTGRIVPIYPQSEKAGISSLELTKYVEEALERAKDFADPLPDSHRQRLALLTRTAAFHAIHAPERMEDQLAARRRLAFDELLRLQVALVRQKRASRARAKGIAHVIRPSDERDLVGQFLAGLPFELTNAQVRAIGEIAADLAEIVPMHRLLQGDVGSGKTVVALATLLYGVQGGYQGALMVPTEVLAEQHYLAARALLADLSVADPTRLMGSRPLSVALLTSRTTGAQRAKLLKDLSNGRIEVLVGTHALLTEEVRFSRLGVVVIDEQHRFGVDQRASLAEKSAGEEPEPDVLVMTATPIPRTAAMTFYGDLDYSVLDELPPSRTPIETIWIDGDDDALTAFEMVRAEVAAGHQAFVVCPLVRPGESSPEDDGAEAPEVLDQSLFDPELEAARPPRSASEELERLASGPLSGLRLGLLHGQLASKDKDAVMVAFRAGELDVLVATTVIEVGVDVPNATVMVIEDADRFGIAQLHQLRGRVGRGAATSWCYLLSAAANPDAQKRLAALQASTDGFALAEVDLELRGEGTVLGTRQKGRNDLKLASLTRHRDLIVQARAVAEEILDADGELEENPVLRDELVIYVNDDDAEYLQRS
jgi:ATP-dependent DNA helicase RecG